ncbi:MAG: D-2-hydroxyacid dehydrogenase [Chloroflexia bacterium]|nr:D-2-hydroxyacid dehydrogenase [Chloroflexia bacterium]
MSQPSLSVLIASAEGQDYYHLLDDLPGLSIRRCAPPEVTEQCAEIDIFFGKPSAEVLAAAPKLKWIQAPSAGVEFVASIPVLVESDIVLTNTRGAHGPSIGEHTFALLLALTRHIPESVDQQRRRHWDRGQLYRTAREIGGMTMGLIGFGAIARGIAQRAEAFEINLLAVDAQAVSGDPYLDEVWPVSQLDDLLTASDVVVVAAPYTGETHHLLDASRIARMKPDAYLIAVSRGGIIVEEALVAALTEGRLAGAALDVTEIEPLPVESPLWDAPNLLLTPHLAGASAPKERRVVEIFRDNLERFMNGEPLMNVVDKRLGY